MLSRSVGEGVGQRVGVEVDGQPQRFTGSRAAEALGIVLIHQEFNLADDLTVAQNIFLGHEKKCGPFLDDQRMRREGFDLVLAQAALRAGA